MNKIILVLSIGLIGFNVLATELSKSQVAEVQEEDNWSSLAETIVVYLETASTLYSENNGKEAKREIIKAYFGVFEDQKMEAAMRMELGAKYTYKVERRFGGLRKAIKKNIPIEEFNQQKQELITIMREDAVKLDKAEIPREVFNVE